MAEIGGLEKKATVNGRLFLVVVGGTYGATWHMLAKAESLDAAQRKAREKWHRITVGVRGWGNKGWQTFLAPKDPAKETYPDCEVVLDQDGCSEIITFAW